MNKIKRKTSVHNIMGVRFGKLLVIEKTSRRDSDGNIYWKCKCDCGNFYEARTRDLNRGHALSCGCIHRYEKGDASLNILFCHYKRDAKTRNLKFNLSKYEFKELTSSNCRYCRVVPMQRMYGRYTNGDYIYNGIDRVDSSKGYTPENCVPCCKRCNQAKNNMSEAEFKEWIIRIYNNYVKDMQ